MAKIVFDESKFKHPFLEASTFEVIFPKHRAVYLQSVVEYILKACDAKKILFEIDYDNCTMKVSTTDRTRDPYIIIKANELIQLLGKGVELEHAVKVLEDGFMSEIIPIHMMNANRKVFERRRQRLLNPKILNSLQLITKCHVLIANKNACIVGDYRGVNEAKSVIVKCFENLHPAFELRALIIKKKLARDDIEGDWERFLPNIKKTHSSRNVCARVSGGMPEEIRERREDIEMQTGEFYTKSENMNRITMREEQRARREQARRAKAERFIEPDE